MSNSFQVRKYVQKLLNDSPVFILSATYCPYCKQAKQFLKKLDIKYKSIEFDKDPNGEDIADEIERRTKDDSVPAIFIRGKYIGGLEELEDLVKRTRSKNHFYKK